MIVTRLREEAGDLDDGRHGDDAGVGGDRDWWLLGGASFGVAVGYCAVLLVVVWRPGRSNGVADGVGTLVGRICRRKWCWDAGDSVGLSASGTWADRHQGVNQMAALVKTASQTSRTALGLRSGGAEDKGRQATDDSLGRSMCEAAGSAGRSGVANVANGVGTSVGRRFGRDEGRRDADYRVGCSTSVRGWIGVGSSVGTLVGWSCGCERRRGVGNSVGRSASGRGSIGVGASVGLKAFSERRREQCRDLGWLELRTQTALGCRRPREMVVVGTWVDRRQDVVRARYSVGQSASGRRSEAGESWSSTASSRWSGLLEID